jgi:hypothetical protein
MVISIYIYMYIYICLYIYIFIRNKFDQLFNQDIKLLESCLNIQSYGDSPRVEVNHEVDIGVEGGDMGNGDAILSSLKALMLSSDDITRLLATLNGSQGLIIYILLLLIFLLLMPSRLICMEIYGIDFVTILFVIYIFKHHHH